MPRYTPTRWNSTQPYFTQPDADIPVLELVGPPDLGFGALKRLKGVLARYAEACRRGLRPVRWAANARV